jgi:outer membrane immunogenic protein
MKLPKRLLSAMLMVTMIPAASARADGLIPSSWLPASSADLGPVKWSGFYFTPYFGYETLKLNGRGQTGLKDPKGGRLGGEAGYDWQIDRVVIGVAAEGYATWYKGGSTPFMSGTQTRLNDYGTVRGRIGYTFDRFLVYGTGGYAFGDLNVKNTTVGLSDSHTLNGWTAGAGVDWAWRQNQLLRFEVAHIALGQAAFTPLPAGRQSLGADLDLFKVTFISHF